MHIRKLVELNFPKDCYERYLHLIEPGLESFFNEFFRDWQAVETYTTLIVMRHQGVFKVKDDIIKIDEDEDERLKDQLDVPKFRKLKKMPISQKFDYLLSNMIIGENCHRFLSFANDRRNAPLHDWRGMYTDEDLQIFQKASGLVIKLYFNLKDPSTSDDERVRLRGFLEVASKDLFEHFEQGKKT